MANRKYPYEQMETAYVASDDLSVRALCRQNNITSVGQVHEYARRHKWAEKRLARQAQTDEKKIEILGDRMAKRQARLEDLVDKTISVIDVSLDRLERDIRDNPEVKIGVRDLALLADRILVLRGQPSQIIEERNLGLSFTGPVRSDQLDALLELTRGVPSPDGRGSRGSAIPRVAPGDEGAGPPESQGT